MMNRNVVNKVLLVIVLATVMGMGMSVAGEAGEGRQSGNGVVAFAPTGSAVLLAANPHRLCISERDDNSVAAVTAPKRHQVAAMLIEE